MSDFIPVNEPLLNGNEKKYLMECIDTGWISSDGPFVQRFEDEMANLTGRKHAIAVSNGTVALELAVATLELQPGDEIIMPTFTIISCALAAVRLGCIPVLVDCDESTWNMDISQIESKITKKTKAIMIVHIYGLPVDVDPIVELAHKYNLKIIEDAAEMHGQTYKGKPCGSFGDISIFSFYPNKHITTGEGGMLLTNDDRLASRCKSLRNLCFKPEKRFLHEELGYNFRMTNLQAAIGMAQLERLEYFIDRKRTMGRFYNNLLSDIQGLQIPVQTTDYARNIYWVFAIVLKRTVPIDADEMIRKLTSKGIGTRPFFWPLHEQPVFRKMGLFKNDKFPVAENIARRGFYVPSGLGVSEAQMNIVAEQIINIMKEIG